MRHNTYTYLLRVNFSARELLMSVMRLLHAVLYDLPGAARRHVGRKASSERFCPIVTEVNSVRLITNETMDGNAQLDIKNLINSRDT
jgi:hypothetical protein